MSTVILRRSGRLAAPPVPEGEVRVPAPPTGLGRVGGPGPFQLLMPVISSGGGLAMMLANPNPMLVLSGSLMAGAGVVTGVGMFVQTRRQGRVQAANTRRRYIAHLAGLRRDLQAAAQAQRAAAAWSHPAPGQLWALAGSRHRLWERRTGDGDFLAVRAGVGRVPLRLEPRLDGATQLVMADPDPACSAAASGLVRRWGSIDGQPCSFPWARSARSSCRGRGREPSAASGRWSPRPSSSTPPRTSSWRWQPPPPASPTGSGASGCPTSSMTTGPTGPAPGGSSPNRSTSSSSPPTRRWRPASAAGPEWEARTSWWWSTAAAAIRGWRGCWPGPPARRSPWSTSWSGPRRNRRRSTGGSSSPPMAPSAAAAAGPPSPAGPTTSPRPWPTGWPGAWRRSGSRPTPPAGAA